MGDVQALAGLDRLPWLADDAPSRGPRRRRAKWPQWLAVALAALGLVAAAAYWAGTRRATDSTVAAVPQLSRPPVTIPLPAPSEPMPPQPEVKIDTPPEVEPIAAPLAPVVRTLPNVRRVRSRAPVTKSRAEHKQKVAVRPAVIAPPKSDALPIWPVRAEQYSAGRLVRVGTFATPLVAKRGWGKIMRFYPGMKRLPALVVPIRAFPSGRQYYRLQMGTTSQAHSEVLCQRMRIIGVSCVVLNIGATRR